MTGNITMTDNTKTRTRRTSSSRRLALLASAIAGALIAAAVGTVLLVRNRDDSHGGRDVNQQQQEPKWNVRNPSRGDGGTGTDTGGETPQRLPPQAEDSVTNAAGADVQAEATTTANGIPVPRHEREPTPTVDVTVASTAVRNSSPTLTYEPGELTVDSGNGLVCSTGLTARVIARSGQSVQYADGTSSTIDFHELPDGGATFEGSTRGSSTGWVYVSNSEVLDDGGGGVGAITFDGNGDVTDYKMVLTGTTSNCSGGKSAWDTWISCEENLNDGQIYEVDPWGEEPARLTEMGSNGGNFETVAMDNRDPAYPKFYVTNDRTRGEIRKFKPDPQIVDDARNGNGDYWDILSNSGDTKYLVFRNDGTFYWSPNRDDGQDSAQTYYPKTEGIAFVEDQDGNGYLYFAAKLQKEIFKLNLADKTYTDISTETSIITGEPDQVKFLGDSGSGVMYFTEERVDDTLAGVHGRDADGNFFTVCESTEISCEDEETNGLAFSPDKKHMYIAVQCPGILYDITRDDGLPFDGDVLDIHHH